MTRLQSNLVKGVSIGALGVAFGFGSAWMDTKRDIAAKADAQVLDTHIRDEAIKFDSVTARWTRITDGLCVGERNPYRRRFWDCDARGIR